MTPPDPEMGHKMARFPNLSREVVIAVIAGVISPAIIAAFMWTWSYISSVRAPWTSAVPVGTIIAYYGSTASDPPSGYLLCNRTKVEHDKYPELYKLLEPKTKSEGDVWTPDLQDQFLRGVGNGRAVGSREQEAVGAHRHYTVVAGESGSGRPLRLPPPQDSPIVADGDYGSTPGGGDKYRNYSLMAGTGSPNTGLTGDPKGIAGSGETRPKNVGVIFLIRAY